MIASNWRSEMSLHDFLLARRVVAIAGIDTRRLTRILREKGAQSGCIAAGAAADKETAAALAAARDFPGLAGMDLAKEVSARESYPWSQGSWRLAGGDQPRQASYRIVAYDYGIKRNILRLLADRGCDITVVPAQCPAHKALEFEPDGIFLSNGPGDPEPCVYAVNAIRELLQTGLPVFGICLGHQLLALACGARTLKMKFGHHGGNHPVQDLATGQVLITSQNHGFAVDESSLPATLRATHRSLFDGTLQGIECVDKPAFGFQGHPEASPGPHDISPLFDHFIQLLAARRAV